MVNHNFKIFVKMLLESMQYLNSWMFLFREFESSLLKTIASQALRRLMSIILLDLFIIITMMLIPAAIVKQLEACMSYGGKSIVIPDNKHFHNVKY